MKAQYTFLLFFLLFIMSCGKKQDEDLNYIHLKQVATSLSNDLSSISKDVVNAAQIIHHKIDFLREVNAEIVNEDETRESNTIYLEYAKDSVATFLPITVELDNSLQKIIANSKPIDTLIVKICKNNSLVAQSYFLDTNSFLRIFPYINVNKQYLPNVKLNQFIAFQSVFNKPFNENAYWLNEPFADPSGRGWIISCTSPIYYQDQFFGIISADIMLKSVCEKAFSSPYEMWIIINLRGEVLGCTKMAATFFNIPTLKEYSYFKPIDRDVFMTGHPSLLNHQKKEIQKAISSVIEGKNKAEFIYNSRKTTIYSLKIKETEWLLLKIIN